MRFSVIPWVPFPFSHSGLLLHIRVVIGRLQFIRMKKGTSFEMPCHVSVIAMSRSIPILPDFVLLLCSNGQSSG